MFSAVYNTGDGDRTVSTHSEKDTNNTRSHPAGWRARRTMLKLGVGMAAVAAAGRYFATGSVLAALPVSGRPTSQTLPVTAEITGVADHVLGLRTKTGERLSATAYGFPSGITPRVGDLVALAERDAAGAAEPPVTHSQPACLRTSTLSDPASQRELSAVPLATWRTGIPAVSGSGRLSINGVALVESRAVREAAVKGQTITIFTLDSALDTQQVLGTTT